MDHYGISRGRIGFGSELYMRLCNRVSIIICMWLIVSWQLEPGQMDETQIATILREILKGLDYLHSEKKIHRDIKGTLRNECRQSHMVFHVSYDSGNRTLFSN
ncbi:unnamed protein product [Ranitomeya imitator]|uniref:Protein kinase domain-containing protein n=1 Tax=Ranitomeya imitator TaxID=111125 RepID=A0ABN9MVF7_9NEOB|nr:unnamed protein product [Ranitomeya imitator]